MAWISRIARGATTFVLSTLLVAGTAMAGGLKDGPSAPPPAKKWLPWYESGGFLSTEQHRAEGNLFAPLWQSSVALLFFQGTGKYFEDDIQEGNFDIGFRKMHRSGWNFGLWGGYDVRHTEADNTFHQVSFGFEALSDRWDVRANGYVALSDPEASPDTARVFLSGNNIFLTGGEEVPLSGFDGEVGYKVFSKRGGHGSGLKDGLAAHGPSHELRVYAGGFYFDDGEALEEVAGPRARIEWRIDDVVRRLPGSRLTFEGEFQYDEVREDQWEGGVRFRVPFGGGGKDVRQTILASLTPQERRMTESIVRDTDIVTAESDAEGVSDDLTGTRFESVTVVDNAGDLQQRIDDAGGDSLIVVKGDTHQGPIVLGPDQTLQGGGSTIRVRGVESGVVADFTAPGSRPFIELAQDQAVLTVDRNTHVAGVGIRGAGLLLGFFDNDGIVSLVDGISNIAITDTTITDVGGDGIRFGNDHNKILISRTTISDTDAEGIKFNNNNTNIIIRNATINNAGADAIDFDDNNSNVLVQNVTADTTANEAIEFDNNNTNIIIRNATINNAGSDAIEFDNNNSNVLVQNVTADTTGNEGIEFHSNNSNIRIVDNVLTNIGNSTAANDENAIQLDDNNTNVVISGNTINGAAGSAFDFDGNNTITLDNNIVTGVIAEDLLEVNVGGNTINGAGNVNNAVIGGALCDGAGNFAGTLQIDGTVIVNAGPPCI